MEKLASDALADFRQVAALAGVETDLSVIQIDLSAKPHKSPRSLPVGMMAVYAFFLDGKALKVGKAGAKSAARYTSQHYLPGSAMSNLVRSVLAYQSKIGASDLDPQSVGAWIKANTDRVNILVPESAGLPILSLLEAFLHVRWKPLFEGRTVAD